MLYGLHYAICSTHVLRVIIHVPNFKNEKHSFIEVTFRATRFRTGKLSLRNEYCVCKLHPLGDCGSKVNSTRALVMHTACFVMFIYRSYVNYVDCGTAEAADLGRA